MAIGSWPAGIYFPTDSGQPTILGGLGQAQTNGTISATAGSNYDTVPYLVAATGGGCTRRPTGVWVGSGTTFQVTNPGFNCATNPRRKHGNRAGYWAQQTTGANRVSTICTSNLPSMAK
jgi:hypothetical protein